MVHCKEYRSTGKCTYAAKHNGACQWPHLTDEMVKRQEEKEKARVKQRADAKASQPNAKAKAKPRAKSRANSTKRGAAAAPLAMSDDE